MALAAQNAGWEVHVATNFSLHRDEIKQLGLNTHQLSFTRSGFGIFQNLFVIIKIFLLLKTIKPSIAHLVTIKPILLGGIAARIANTQAVVAAVSGLGYLFISSRIQDKPIKYLISTFYKIALRHKNIRVIFQNSDDLEQISSITKLSSNSALLFNGSGVNLSQFSATPIPTGAPLIILPSRLLIDKGVREFVSAAKILKNQNVRAKFALVGDIDPGNPASITKEEIKKWKCEKYIEFWGERHDMPNVYSKAYCVVLPSYREGSPKVLAEAAASGRAVITTDVPGCRDCVINGRTGVVIQPKDAISLAFAMKKLILNRKSCEKMGQNGRQLAKSKFNIDDIVQQHLKLYSEILL